MYAPRGVAGLIIALKTWHNVGHCEGYVGEGKSVASRDGIGVGLYPTRTDGLIRILRPVRPFDLVAATTWFKTVRGQKYDWLGLVRFAWHARVVPNNLDNRQFCSEFLTRWYRRGGVDPFPREDADAVAPFQFDITDAFDLIWSAD